MSLAALYGGMLCLLEIRSRIRSWEGSSLLQVEEEKGDQPACFSITVCWRLIVVHGSGADPAAP